LSNIDPSLSWTEHLVHIFKTCRLHYQRNLLNRKFSNQVTKLMQNILTAESYEEVQLIINEITLFNEKEINVGETTNIAESAHADINRDGKELSLMNAIEKLDIRKFTTCKIQDKYGIAKTGRNNGPISHALQSIKHYDKKRNQQSSTNKNKRIKSNSTKGNSTKDNSLSQLEQQILLEERQLEIEERKEKLREKKLQNYEKARELGIEKELGYED
ncbi:22548_t:CDS:2, partial [Dentiscutata erythropus]